MQFCVRQCDHRAGRCGIGDRRCAALNPTGAFACDRRRCRPRDRKWPRGHSKAGAARLGCNQRLCRSKRGAAWRPQPCDHHRVPCEHGSWSSCSGSDANRGRSALPSGRRCGRYRLCPLPSPSRVKIRRSLCHWSSCFDESEQKRHRHLPPSPSPSLQGRRRRSAMQVGRWHGSPGPRIGSSGLHVVRWTRRAAAAGGATRFYGSGAAVPRRLFHGSCNHDLLRNPVRRSPGSERDECRGLASYRPAQGRRRRGSVCGTGCRWKQLCTVVRSCRWRRRRRRRSFCFPRSALVDGSTVGATDPVPGVLQCNARLGRSEGVS